LAASVETTTPRMWWGFSPVAVWAAGEELP